MKKYVGPFLRSYVFSIDLFVYPPSTSHCLNYRSFLVIFELIKNKQEGQKCRQEPDPVLGVVVVQRRLWEWRLGQV